MTKLLLIKKKTHLQTAYQRPIYIFSLVILFFSLNQQVSRRGLFLQESAWSTPQTIPGYDPATVTPILIADQNRTVHAFSSQLISSPGKDPVRAIFYNKWTLENGWTTPVDIIISPVEEARLTDVYLDKSDTFHLTFYGGNNTNANIYYTKAPLALAADSRAWSTPLIVGEDASDPEAAAIIENEQGAIVVVYNGRQQGNGLYVIDSIDGGDNWSAPTPIFFAQSDRPNISRLDVIKDTSGQINAIWGLYSLGGQGRGIYYASSGDGIEWNEPVLLADANDGLGTQTPSLIEYDNSLVAIFNLPPKIVMRRSTDHGITWNGPAIIFPRHVGVNGSLAPVIDSNNNLHLFFGQRISGNPDIHGMWHSIFKGDRWTEPSAVVKGPRIWDTKGLTSFDPYEAHAAVSQGNVILVTWITDLGERRPNGVFYSYSVLDAPELPVVAVPTASIPDSQETYQNLASATPLATAAVEGEPTPLAIFDRNPQEQRSRNWIIIGGLMIGVFVFGYLLFVRGR